MKNYLLIAFLLFGGAAVAQDEVKHEGPVKWLTFEQAVERSKTEKRKIFIDVYTDWCGWCKKMDENTFTDAGVIALINTDFTIAKFNAETADVVMFNGKSYNFISSSIFCFI